MLTNVFIAKSDHDILPDLSFYIKSLHTGINSRIPQLLLNPEQLIVLCNTLGTGRCTCLDLAGVQRYSQIRNGGIRRLAGTMRRDCGITSLVSHLDRLQCLGYGTDLVQLDQDRIACAQFDTLAQSLCIGNEKVITD